MNGHRRLAVLSIAALLLACSLGPSAGRAGILDAMKKKATDKATQKTTEATDKAANSAEKAVTGSKDAAGKSAPAASEEGADKPVAAAAGDGKVSSVSTKFDYVPGDKVLFLDDFTQDELGEFPARWALKQGTYEVAEMDGKRWLRSVSDDAVIRMKLPAMTTLPEFWTLEFDFYGVEPVGSGFFVKGLTDAGQAWEAVFFNGPNAVFRSGELFSSTPMEGAVGGHHHLMFMARGNALKVYLDRQRVANVPDVSAAGMPKDIEFRMFSTTKPMIGNVRFAEGCRPPKDMLAEGKLVTYGIRFDTGSDIVLPESAPVLRQVAAYMETNAQVKLRITGHTDNVGSAASNLDLSKRRAASVARVLAEQFSIPAERFETDGKGDTQTVSSNAKPEGRAMNRRVEFAKL